MTLPRTPLRPTLAVLLVVALAGCGRKTDPRAQEGYDLIVAGRVDEAIAHANAILADEPENAQQRNVLGLALYKSGDAEAAVIEFDRAIAAEPDFAEAHFNRGNALRQLGRLEDAEAAYSKAIRHQKDFVLAHYNLGKIYEGSGRIDQALAEYRRCVDLDPQYLYGFIDLGKYHYETGDFDRAIANLSRALELEPGIKEVRVLLGNAYMRSGVENNLQLAENEFRAAVGLDSQYVDAVYSLGVVLATQNRTDESIVWFERVLDMTEEDSAMNRQVVDYFESIDHPLPSKGDASAG